MGKGKVRLFGDDDDDGGGESQEPPSDEFSINKNYASSYENWRRLEEMQKIKDRYGDANSEESSSSEEEAEWTPNDEKDFLQTLGALKSGDESIYDNSKRFFEMDPKDDVKGDETAKKNKQDNKKPMTLKDYERKLVLERGGNIDESDGEDDDNRQFEPGYYEEQESIRKSLRTALHGDDDNDGELLVRREKSAKEKEIEEDDFYQWLKGSGHAEDKTKPKELKRLKKIWSDPNLDESDKFLRDFLLNKDYEPNEQDELPSYDEIVALEQDEQELDRQREYERNYNFRFEDPDQEFLKSYPRMVTESVRADNSKRKEKRTEREERKKTERDERTNELKQLKRMKKTEIDNKLAKLRKAAGSDIPISVDDLQADFDPKEFDRKMKEIFNDKYYGEEEALQDDEAGKPIFSDDEAVDSDYEDYDDLDVSKLKSEAPDNEDDEGIEENGSEKDGVVDGEQVKARNSINAAMAAVKQDAKDGRRSRKRNALKDALRRKKPLFDPKEKTFEEYFNEYFALDYEDVIGDQVTRFKYREVVPNNFGLSADEILDADERQLNSWASLKKVTAYRTEQEEKFDLLAYKKKSMDTAKKKRIFSNEIGWRKKKKEVEKEANVVEEPDNSDEPKKKKKRRVKKKAKEDVEQPSNNETANEAVNDAESQPSTEAKPESESAGVKKPPRKGGIRKNTNLGKKSLIRKTLASKLGHGMTEARVKAYGLNPSRLSKGFTYRNKKS